MFHDGPAGKTFVPEPEEGWFEAWSRAKNESKAWQETAEQAQSDRTLWEKAFVRAQGACDHYHEILNQIGKLIGGESHEHYNGHIANYVVVDRLPELVARLIERIKTHENPMLYGFYKSGDPAELERVTASLRAMILDKAVTMPIIINRALDTVHASPETIAAIRNESIGLLGDPEPAPSDPTPDPSSQTWHDRPGYL
jgi:hypothetical protein